MPILVLPLEIVLVLPLPRPAELDGATLDFVHRDTLLCPMFVQVTRKTGGERKQKTWRNWAMWRALTHTSKARLARKVGASFWNRTGHPD